MQNSTQKTLVLGGTGKTGRRIVNRLFELNHPVRIGSRSGIVPFDWDDASTWKKALEDIHSVYISFQPDLAVPGAVEIIRAFVETAVKNDVKKLVLLSGRGEPEAQQCEEIVMASGVEWTIIRASWFFQNFSEGYLLDPILAGFVALPVGKVREPFIDVDDIAEIGVVALTQEGHAGQIYEVTGPRLMTFKDCIEEIASAKGTPIQFQQVTMDEYTAMLKEYNIPEDYISLVVYLFSEVLDGRNESLTNGVERALGRKPTDFSEYVRKTLASGAWQVNELIN
jgi:uncharacterized protein YbjT (DUF2867 family)